jgi:hypothetical protein
MDASQFVIRPVDHKSNKALDARSNEEAIDMGNMVANQ